MKKYTGIIFDFDGVLADSYQFNFIACKNAAERCGIAFNEMNYDYYFPPGTTLISGTNKLLADKSKEHLYDKYLQLKNLLIKDIQSKLRRLMVALILFIK